MPFYQCFSAFVGEGQVFRCLCKNTMKVNDWENEVKSQTSKTKAQIFHLIQQT